jgi:hypothetical protein
MPAFTWPSDGDGIPDFIVGKRFWSHLDDYFDPIATVSQCFVGIRQIAISRLQEVLS